MSDNMPVPMPKRSHHGPLSKVTSLGDAFEHPQFIARIKDATPKHLSPDRMLSVFIQSVQKTPLLAKCPLMSLLGAFVSVATVGLEPNTALQHAFLIPFNKRVKGEGGRWVDGPPQVQVIFGYQGLLELTYRSGLLRSVHADVVWNGDDFDFWYGSNGQLKHRPKGGIRPDTELPTHAYMHANMKDGGESYEVMPMSDVIAIRDASQAYKGALIAKGYAKPGDKKLPAGYTEAPWVKHFVPMARKTAFRSGSKWLPKSIELAGALALDELQDRKTANFAGVIEGSADILDGGLEALPDEATDQINVGIGGSFTGYSQQEDREPVTVSAQEAPQGGARPRAAQSPAPTAQPVQAPSQPAFQAYLSDETGTVMGEMFTDPGLFAEQLLKLLDSTTEGETVIENNQEAIVACKAFPNAAELLLNQLDFIEGQGGAATAQPAVDPALIAAIPLREASPRGYDNSMRQAAAVLPKLDAESMKLWLGNNMPGWRTWPQVKRMEMERMVRTRCEALGLNWHGTQPASAQPTEQSSGPMQDDGDPGPGLD